MSGLGEHPISSPGAVLVPGGVVITQEVMYNEIRATHDAVVGLSLKVEAIGDHENRIRHLERRVWTAAGVAATTAAIFSTIGGVLIAKLIGGV